MQPSNDFLDYLRAWEGRDGRPVLQAYQDNAGVWTIGYGSTEGVTQGMRITAAEAETLFRDDVEEHSRPVANLSMKVNLEQHQFDALCSLVFNIGPSRFITSSPYIMTKLGKYDKVGPAIELWNKVRNPTTGVLEVNRGLVRRRAADRAIFDKADYSGRP